MPGRQRLVVLIVAAVVTVVVAAFALGRGVASDTGRGTSAVAGPTSSPPSGAATAEVIKDFAFTPGTATVKVGSAVTWTNDDPFAHSIKGANGSFVSQDLSQGQTFSTTFTTPGTFPYVCGIHPFMNGTVVVRG
ncbi:MAG TPA: plastocyanin/azurin family copper-binding protein [Acidimicrobiales bacterium]|nr:plastocyanin/azurin family copper-binding protein [Acidimicrobiales bacterium]